MTYSGFDLSTLPKRVTSRVDLDEAKALLASMQATGGASDMAKYETADAARNAGLRAKRLVSHVLPAGKVAKIKTFGVDKKGTPVNENPAAFAWAIALKDAKDADAAESADEAAAE